MNKLAVLEGLLFVVGDDGITLENIKNTLEIDETEARELLKELQEEYEKESHGIRISFLANSFKLTTKKEHNVYYQKLIKTPENNTLSQSALEVLAIIAYNQPITRIKVDELRGVSSSFMIRKLVSKDLIKVSGKSDLPGKPHLYKTTNQFLDYFGLASINDLPKISLGTDEDEEIDLYLSNYKENN